MNRKKILEEVKSSDPNFQLCEKLFITWQAFIALLIGFVCTFVIAASTGTASMVSTKNDIKNLDKRVSVMEDIIQTRIDKVDKKLDQLLLYTKEK